MSVATITIGNEEYTPAQLSKYKAFFVRMLPYMVQGASMEDAAQAVLKRDRELHAVAISDTEEGEMMRKEMAKDIYETIRAQS